MASSLYIGPPPPSITIGTPAGYRAVVQNDGAVAYWRLNETSGTTAYDGIGGNNGTIIGGVTLNQPGPLSASGSKAMLFNGSGWINVPNGAYKAIGTRPVSLEGWFQSTSPIKWCIDQKLNGNSGIPGVSIYGADTSNLYLHIFNGSSSPFSALYIPAPSAYIDGNWHHVVCVVERGTTEVGKIYVDGTLVGSANIPFTGTNFTNTYPFSIGMSNGVATTGIIGQLSEVAIYPIALTPTQVANHYAARLRT